MTAYRPKFVRQWSDPTTTLDWLNCTMAAGAMALDFDTLGHYQEWGGELRAACGDKVGGTGLGSPGLEQAWRHYGQRLYVETGDDWAGVMRALKAHRNVVLQGIYGSLPKIYRSKLNSLGFAGPHAVDLNPEFNDGSILMGDPLNDKWIWVPESALKSFAAALGRKEYGTSSKLFFATSDAHVPVPTVTDPVDYVHTVQVTASPYMNIRETASAGAADVGNLAYGAKFKTTHLRRYGGRYVVNGVIRTDWLGFIHNGEEDWVARAYTKVVT